MTTETLAMTRRNSPSFLVRRKTEDGFEDWITPPKNEKLLPAGPFVK
jgi:hypothetical protein